MLLLCVFGPLFWFCASVLCFAPGLWSCALVQCLLFVVILGCGSVLWRCALFLLRRCALVQYLLFCALVLCCDAVRWLCGLVLSFALDL